MCIPQLPNVRRYHVYVSEFAVLSDFFSTLIIPNTDVNFQNGNTLAKLQIGPLH